MKTLIVKNNTIRAILLAGEALSISEGYPVTVADNFGAAVGDAYTYAEPVVAPTMPTLDPSRLVVVSTDAPVNADGRPDGTIYVQTA
jgi:hypothetical protein